MAGKPMTKEIIKVFDDLDDYLRFCKEFGWSYNEADLYRQDAPGYAEYLRFKAGLVSLKTGCVMLSFV